MTFPVIATTNTTASTDASPTTVNMPASISAGDLLIVICAADVGDTITQSGGSDWTKVEQVNQAGVIGLIIFAKIAAGSDALTVTSTGSNDIACISLRITGHGVTSGLTELIRGTAATGSNAAPDPPNCNQGTVQDNLWIECFAADDDDDTTNYETSGYTKVAQVQSASSTTSSLCACASLNSAASAVNPGVMAMAAVEEWVAQTLAVPPAAVSQVTNTWNLRHDLASAVTNTWNLRHDLSSAVTNTWTIRYDMSGSVTNTWNLRHDLGAAVSQIWNLRHDLSSAVEQIWNLRHDMAGSVSNIWNLRHDLLSSISNIWNLRHDLSSAVSNTWTFRHDLAAQVERIWSLRHDLASKIEQVWNLRHDLYEYVSRIWTFRHQLLEGESETPKIRYGGPPSTSKKVKIGLKFPIYYKKKHTFKFNISVFTKHFETIKLNISNQSKFRLSLKTSNIENKTIKIPTYLQIVEKIELKPDYRLDKFIKLTRLERLLRESSLNE